VSLPLRSGAFDGGIQALQFPHEGLERLAVLVDRLAGEDKDGLNGGVTHLSWKQ